MNPQESQGLKNAYGTHKNNQNRVIWDMMPEYWTNHPEFCTKDGWRSTEAAQMSNMPALYDRVAKGLDELLASHGYHREGNMYRTEKGNEDTIALYCHFGVSCVMLSYLWGISPFILWHSLMMAPTSMTELMTEEREEGKVFFRADPHRGYLSIFMQVARSLPSQDVSAKLMTTGRKDIKMKLLYEFGVIMAATFLGEICHAVLPFPIPASIYGLLLMLFALCTKIIKLEQVKVAGDFLLDIMPPMFIPAGVGLLTAWPDLKPVLVPVLVITVVVTVFVMVVTGRVSQRVIWMTKEKEEEK